MGNRLIVRYRRSVEKRGGRWAVGPAGRWRSSVGAACAGRVSCEGGGRPLPEGADRRATKSPRGAERRPYRKPTLVGGGQTLQAGERTLVKELGKLAP